MDVKNIEIFIFGLKDAMNQKSIRWRIKREWLEDISLPKFEEEYPSIFTDKISQVDYKLFIQNLNELTKDCFSLGTCNNLECLISFLTLSISDIFINKIFSLKVKNLNKLVNEFNEKLRPFGYEIQSPAKTSYQFVKLLLFSS